MEWITIITSNCFISLNSTTCWIEWRRISLLYKSRATSWWSLCAARTRSTRKSLRSRERGRSTGYRADTASTSSWRTLSTSRRRTMNESTVYSSASRTKRKLCRREWTEWRGSNRLLRMPPTKTEIRRKLRRELTLWLRSSGAPFRSGRWRRKWRNSTT